MVPLTASVAILLLFCNIVPSLAVSWKTYWWYSTVHGRLPSVHKIVNESPTFILENDSGEYFGGYHGKSVHMLELCQSTL